MSSESGSHQDGHHASDDQHHGGQKNRCPAPCCCVGFACCSAVVTTVPSSWFRNVEFGAGQGIVDEFTPVHVPPRTATPYLLPFALAPPA